MLGPSPDNSEFAKTLRTRTEYDGMRGVPATIPLISNSYGEIQEGLANLTFPAMIPVTLVPCPIFEGSLTASLRGTPLSSLVSASAPESRIPMRTGDTGAEMVAMTSHACMRATRLYASTNDGWQVSRLT